MGVVTVSIGGLYLVAAGAGGAPAMRSQSDGSWEK